MIVRIVFQIVSLVQMEHRATLVSQHHPRIFPGCYLFASVRQELIPNQTLIVLIVCRTVLIAQMAQSAQLAKTL
jgi:hypothetical protein